MVSPLNNNMSSSVVDIYKENAKKQKIEITSEEKQNKVPTSFFEQEWLVQFSSNSQQA